MNRSERLTGIILALQGGRTTANDLARRFEVSRRTVLRDIDALSQIGIPIVAMPGKSGGYEIVDSFWLAPLQLTLDEASILLLALKSLGSSTVPFGHARWSAEAKLRAVLPAELVHRAEADIAAIEVAPPHRAEFLQALPVLRHALSDGRWLAISYRSLRRTADHAIRPRRIYAEQGRWYCEAVSLASAALRTFRIDRIVDATLTSTPPDEDAIVAVALRSPRATGELRRIVLDLTDAALRRFEDHPDFAGPVANAVDGRVTLESPESELDYFAREIFAAGPDVRVIDPAEFRRRIAALAEATLRAAADPNGDSLLSPLPSYDGREQMI